MAKLYFCYAAMGAGKSAHLLQTEFNYRERGMTCLLLTAAIDTRSGGGLISSRLGMSAQAKTFTPGQDLMNDYLCQAARDGIACVLVDEAQFLTADQVRALGEAADMLSLPVMTFGLRTDFTGTLFPGSAALLASADELREIKTICSCGKKATYVLRKNSDGTPTFSGAQIEIGGNDRYVPVCRRHWLEAWIEAGRPALPGPTDTA